MVVSDLSQRASVSYANEAATKTTKRRAETELANIEEEERSDSEGSQSTEVQMMELNQPSTEAGLFQELPAGSQWADTEQGWVTKKKGKEKENKPGPAEFQPSKVLRTSNSFKILGTISSSEESSADIRESTEPIDPVPQRAMEYQESVSADYIEDTAECARKEFLKPVHFETQGAVEEFMSKMV